MWAALPICAAFASATPARAQLSLIESQPVLISAGQIVYDQKNERVRAEGDVELTQNGRRLLADRIEYDIAGSRVTAHGDIVLLDELGNAVFAEELEVTDDLADGFIRQVGVLLADESRMAAAAGKREDGRKTTLDEVVYSPCEICEDGGSPLWQIRADRVVHDQEERTVSYRNATFEVLGVPVAYTPYFYHPDPTVERQTGFLTPRVGTDTELGFTLETPFFVDLAPNRDLTVSPLLTSKEGALLGLELRDLQPVGRTELRGSITHTSDYQRDPDVDEGKAVRGHIEGEGRYLIEGERQVGFDLALASDNTFLNRYDFSDEDVLENRVYLEQFEGRDFLGVDAYAFQGLREDDDQGTIPVALPWIRGRMVGDPGPGGSFFFADASLLALTRTEGLDTRRLSTELGWQMPLVGRLGELVRIRAGLRGDVYSLDGDAADRSGQGGTDTTARVVPRASIDVSWPLVGVTGGWSHVVEPIVSATFIGNNANRDDIPNEDSLVFEFDETNLFEADRFTGLDRVETGSKVSYGLRFDSVGPSAWRVSGIVGQSFREGPDGTLPRGSGLETALSDYVGRIDLRPGPQLDLSYRFRLAKDELTFRRSDLSLRFGPPRLRFDIQYLQLSENLPDTGINKRQEIVAGARLQVVDSLAVAAQFRRDLTLDRPVANSFGLLYTNPCLVVLAGVERNFTEKGELEDETRFSVRVSFRSLGDLVANSSIF